MKAGVYLRISQDRHGLELGVERQREDCEALCKQRGWTPIVFADNDISAYTKVRRPQYERLMAEVDAGGIGAIVTYQTSRLWVKRVERARDIERLKRAGVSVVPVKGPEIDMTTAYGRAMAGLLGEFDTMEREVKSERQQREARQRAEQGRYHGGPRMFGFTADGCGIVEAEAELIRHWYTVVLSGGSLMGLRKELLAAGAVAAHGRPWRDSTIRAILLNPRTAGLRVVYGERFPAPNPPIVSEETWLAACAVLNDPARRSGGGGRARKYLGSGLLRCERCDRPARTAYNTNGATDTAWRIYVCKKIDGGCGRSWKAEPIDAWLEDLVAERLGRPDVADLLTGSGPEVDVAALREQAIGLRQRLDALAVEFAEGELTSGQLRIATQRLKAKLAEVDARRAEVSSTNALALLLTADDPVKAWRELSAVDRRQAVVETLMTVRLGAPLRGRTPWDAERFITVDWR